MSFNELLKKQLLTLPLFSTKEASDFIEQGIDKALEKFVFEIKGRKIKVEDDNVLLQDRALDYDKLIQYIINELGAKNHKETET